MRLMLLPFHTSHSLYTVTHNSTYTHPPTHSNFAPFPLQLSQFDSVASARLKVKSHTHTQSVGHCASALVSPSPLSHCLLT